jgi:hypothetical protein
MYAQIGNIILSNAYGFSGFSDERGAAIAEHSLYGTKPRIQKTGDNLIKLNFSLSLNRNFINPETEITKFEKLVDDTNPVPITLGNGKFLGNFCLISIKKDVQKTDPQGNIFECSIDISAIEFYSEAIPENKGTAISSNNPNAIKTIATEKSPSGRIAVGVRESQNLSVELEKDIVDAKNAPEKRESKIRSALMKVQTIDQKLSGVYETTANVFTLVNEAQNLKNRIAHSQQLLANLKSFLLIRDVDSAMTANRDFQSSMNNVSNVTSPFTKNYILRRSV